MPACEVCGEEDYECYDGCYYCVHCHTQSQKIHELDQEEDFLEGAFSQGLSIRMPKKTTEDSELNLKKKRKQVDGGRPWTSDEGFQLILREQVKSLIKMGADPVLKDVVFKFWTLYLSRLGMAFSDQERSRALFTKTYPLTRDIYVPTAENPTVPEVRWLKTSLKRGSIQKKDKHVDKMVMEALLGSEEFYEGDNPLDKGEDEDAHRFIGICEENYEEGYLISSERISEFEDSCSLLDTASESSSNSDVGVRCEILLDNSDGGKVGNIGGGADEKCSFSSSSRSEQSEISLDASDEGEIGNVGGGDGKRGSTARGTSKNVAVSIRTRNQASKSFVAASSESVPVTKRTSGRVSKGTVSTKSTSGAERERKENEVFEGTDAAHSEENIVETEDWDKITGKCDPEDDNGLSDNDHDENKLRRGKRKVKRRMKLLAPSKKKIGGTIARTPWRLHMASTLAFCYIGLTFTNGNVVISDIMRWVRNGALPYHNIMDIFPDDMKLSSRDTFTFCGMVQGAVVPPHQRLSRAVGDLCRMLGITLPRLSLERLIGRYIIDMDLPGQLNALAMQLLKNSPVPDEAHVVGVHGIFPYEAMAMAYIVITLKMVIGLDDKTERVMSSYSKKIKDLLGRKAPDCPNVFVWEDWVMNMEEKMSSHRSREMPTNFGDLKGIRDLDACLDHFNLNNPAKLGKFHNKLTPKDPEAAEALKKPLLTLVDNLNEMRISARQSESSTGMDPMDLLLGTPEKADTWKTTYDASQPKTTQLFFDCTIHHITNPRTFLVDIQGGHEESNIEDKDLLLWKKRRRLSSDADKPEENIEAENALEDLVVNLSPAHKRYVLYEPGKITTANRHISYLWLLNVCTVFTESTIQDIDDCVNRIQYSLPNFQIQNMTKSYHVASCQKGLRPQ